MMPFFEQFLEVAPNWVIVITYGGGIGGLSLVVSGIARKLFPRRFSLESAALADQAQMIVLSFAIFVLAIAIGDARTNLSSASEIVQQEAFLIGRFDRQLLRYGAEPTEAIRADLAAYVKSIIEGGWTRMATGRIGGTSETNQLLDRLADDVYGLSPANALQEAMKPVLFESLSEVEKQRESRLEKSSETVPSMFWAVTFILVLMGMILCGRYQRTWPNLFLIAAHMTVIGIGMAFLAIIDVPFRGETSVSKEPFLGVAADIAKPLPAPIGEAPVHAR